MDNAFATCPESGGPAAADELANILHRPNPCSTALHDNHLSRLGLNHRRLSNYIAYEKRVIRPDINQVGGR